MIQCETAQLLAIPLAAASEKMPTGNLGTILLWNNQKKNTDEISNLRRERLILSAKIFSSFVSRFLTTHYGISAETYLPSYRISGQRSVAIMFADIRDFTPTTEVLRNFGLVPELTNFILDYSRAMCEIILGQGGRVQGMAGDGIMALFGEYSLDRKKVIDSAVTAARQMCIKFASLKEQFFTTPRMQHFFNNEYEPMDFRLGIGINFGPVIFDYFGAVGSRVYSPLGDHVNFAQRLETQANRLDEHLHKMRAPILISRPAWVAAGRPAEWGAVPLQVKGKPYEYQAYECWPT